jgi:hypothetical protein
VPKEACSWVGKSANRVSLHQPASTPFYKWRSCQTFILIIQTFQFNIQVRYPIATAVQTGLAQGSCVHVLRNRQIRAEQCRTRNALVVWTGLADRTLSPHAAIFRGSPSSYLQISEADEDASV